MPNNKIQTAVQQQKQNGPQKTLRQYIKSMEGEIAKALPSVMTPERFTRITLSALSANPQLCECTPQSFLGAMMTAAQLGLEPNTPLGQAYLIPRRNHGVWECQFQIGYKGLRDLAYKGGVVTVQAWTVCEKDEFVYELGLDPKLIHKPPLKGDRGKPIAYYAVFKTKEGGYGFAVMTQDEVNDFAKKRSDAFRGGKGPWTTDFEAMAKKTVLKQALKYAPMSVEFARAVAMDETIHSKISPDMFDEPDETDYVTVNDETGEVAEPAALPEAPQDLEYPDFLAEQPEKVTV